MSGTVPNGTGAITGATQTATSLNGNGFTWPPNVTSASTESNTTSEIKLPFENYTVVIVAVLLIFFFVFGFFANLLTMLVILKSKKLTSVFNQFILSLCVSDLLSALISWVNLYRRTWGFNVFALPNFFCVFYWGADMWTSYVTAQHIMSFAVLRLISVWKPVMFSKIKNFHARIWICTIWAIGFFCGFIPFAVFSGARERDRSDRSNPVSRWPACTQNEEWLAPYSEYTLYAYPIFFYIPLIGVLVVSVAIGIVMKRQWVPQSNIVATEKKSKVAKRREKERQAILQLGLIVGSFMLGYVPFTAFEFHTIHSTDSSFAAWQSDWLFGTLQYVCLRFSECLNPIFYNLASTKMRKETYKFLRSLRCAFCPQNVGPKETTITSSTQGTGGLEL